VTDQHDRALDLPQDTGYVLAVERQPAKWVRNRLGRDPGVSQPLKDACPLEASANAPCTRITMGLWRSVVIQARFHQTLDSANSLRRAGRPVLSQMTPAVSWLSPRYAWHLTTATGARGDTASDAARTPSPFRVSRFTGDFGLWVRYCLLVCSWVAGVARGRYRCGVSLFGRSELSPLGGRLERFECAGDRDAELPGGAAEVERAAAVGEQ